MIRSTEITGPQRLTSSPVPAARTLSDGFVQAVSCQQKVTQCPHSLYKYPARFAPEFAREAIREFSAPGDLILDPFSGGGTTLIEAVALQRRAVGFDISTLACFLARAKSTPLSVHNARNLRRWASALAVTPAIRDLVYWKDADTEDRYYQRNLPDELAGTFGALLHAIQQLRNPREERFARLVLLAIGQTALDCRTKLPEPDRLHAEFCAMIPASVDAFRSYTWQLSRKLGVQHRLLERQRRIISASSTEVTEHGRYPRQWGKAKLVVTSPPYPGVHMLYHRWQLLGRRETPAPFLLANCRDGDGIAHYCLGGRHAKGLTSYFDRIEKVFSAVRNQLRSDALVVQMVAFNRPDWQLSAYLAAMNAAGYQEVPVAATGGCVVDGRLWRPVPGRKWYVATRSGGAAGKEVVLIHRPAVT